MGEGKYYPNHTIYGEQQQPNNQQTKKHIFLMNNKRKRGQAMAWILILFLSICRIPHQWIHAFMSLPFFIFKHYRVYFILFSFCILISFLFIFLCVVQFVI